MKRPSSPLWITTIANLNTMTFSGIQILLFTLIPFVTEQTHLTMPSIVASFSFGSILFLWSSPFWSSRSDKWGRQPVLLIGIVGLTVSTGLLLLLVKLNTDAHALKIGVLWFSRILYGMTASAVVPVAQALQVDLAKKDSHMKAMLSNSMSLNIGRALGPLYVLFSGGQNMLVVLEGVFAWAVALILLNVLLMKKDAPHSHAQESAEVTSWLSSFAKLPWVFVLAILFTSFIGALNSSFAVILQKAFALNGAASATLMAKMLLISAIASVAFQFLGKVILKDPWRGAMIFGVVGLLIGTVLLKMMVVENQLMIAVLFLSVGFSFVPPSYLTLMVAGSGRPVGLGKKAGIMGAANTIGYGVGGGLTALAFKTKIFSVESLLLGLVVLMFVNIAVLYKNRHSEVSHA